MHALTYVFVPRRGDIEEAVAKAMWPFAEDLEVEPWKRYLDSGEVSAMASHYGVPATALPRLAAAMEDWNGGKGGADAGGLFAVRTFNPDARWDWYEIGGRWDGRIRGNVAPAATLLRSPRLADILPHDFLTPDGAWHASETFLPADWPDGRFDRKDETAWLAEFRRALAAKPRCRVVAVDRHY